MRMFFHLNDLTSPVAAPSWHQSCILTLASTLCEFKYMDHTDAQAIADMSHVPSNSSETYPPPLPASRLSMKARFEQI